MKGDLRRLLTTAANLEDEAGWLPPYFNEADTQNMRDVASELITLRARVAELEAQIAAIKGIQRWGCPEYGDGAYRDPQGEFVLMEDIEDIIDKLPTSSGEPS